MSLKIPVNKINKKNIINILSKRKYWILNILVLQNSMADIIINRILPLIIVFPAMKLSGSNANKKLRYSKFVILNFKIENIY